MARRAGDCGLVVAPPPPPGYWGCSAALVKACAGLGRIVALPLIRFILDSLTYSVPLFLNRQCDRTLGLPALPLRRPARLRGLRHRARAGAAAGGLHTGVHRQSEHGAVSLQKSGQLQPFVTVFPQGCMGQRASFGPT
jgi:hypothetical protein